MAILVSTEDGEKEDTGHDDAGRRARAVRAVVRVGRDRGALNERAPSHVDALADVGRQRQRGVRHERPLEVQRLERVALHERRAARVALRRRQRRVVSQSRVREVAHEALELRVPRHKVRLRVDLDEAAAAIQSARRHEAVRGRARLELRRAARALLAQPLEGLLQSRRRLDGGLAVDQSRAGRLAQLLDQFHGHGFFLRRGGVSDALVAWPRRLLNGKALERA